MTMDMSNTIKSLCKESHQIAKDHGWWEGERNLLELLALVHSEVSEAVECVRDHQMEMTIGEKGKPLGLPSELADIVIRVFDLSEHLGIDLEKAVRLKTDFNKTRPYRHGGKAA
jgi:NTP pyrophosphatase (non-canonical NTP hydrolase)